MRRVENLSLPAAILAALALAACGKPALVGRPAQAGDVAVAKVDGRAIWKSDVAREAVAQGLIADGETLGVGSDLFQKVLDEVVDQKLLAAEAVRRGLDHDPAAQRRLAAARERILGDMVVERQVEKAVNESAVHSLFDAQSKLQKPGDEFHARQIVLASQADAEAVRKLLGAGASFEGLAAGRSTDPETRSSGGDLGYFAPEVMPPAYGEALKTAKPGQIVGPIRIDDGWALLKLEDRRKQAPMTLDAARPQIVRFLTYAQVGQLLKALRATGKVEILAKPDAPQTNPTPQPQPTGPS
jgi:peptidyl-prolyl cis-trans isomerase C